MCLNLPITKYVNYPLHICWPMDPLFYPSTSNFNNGNDSFSPMFPLWFQVLNFCKSDVPILVHLNNNCIVSLKVTKYLVREWLPHNMKATNFYSPATNCPDICCPANVWRPMGVCSHPYHPSLARNARRMVILLTHTLPSQFSSGRGLILHCLNHSLY